ncbi:hypothetical protein GGQ99_002450 [Aminobacter niigataensis]|uniref:Uncharacterized protein n=1 Tax=Aminobacter niigataensis TaxID=83265 RepID=A0ABR6L1T6_9HYPH|nr:hypothetical protein [Aminobacter niigataensis]MBB4650695.1 hypothetical protein [Aminobacter niigataensis]
MDHVEREKFELAIGKLTVAWAVAEHGLDQCISVIYHLKGGHSISKSLPLNARDKIKFFRKSVRSLPELSKASHHADYMADMAFRILDDRNWCVHGVALQVGATLIPHPIELTRLQRPHMISLERKDVTLDSINKVMLDCMPLLLGFAFFLHDPLDIIPTEHVQQTLGRFRVDWPV